MIGKWRLAWGLSSERFGVVTRWVFGRRKKANSHKPGCSFALVVSGAWVSLRAIFSGRNELRQVLLL
jgi:hypothetical protein